MGNASYIAIYLSKVNVSADVKMRQIEKDAADSTGIDGVDAPEVRVDALGVNIQLQKIDNVEKKEAQAEREE